MEDLSNAARRVLEGDASAFQAIVDATSTRLVRLGARLVGSVTEAEDVVQDAYVKAYRALTSGSFDGRSSVHTWLYRIVANTALDALRARTRRPAPTDTAGEMAWDGLASAEARVALSELATLLDALPAEQRTALVLQTVEGLTTQEVAEIMGLTVGAVEQKLVRARQTLRARRADEEEGGSRDSAG